MVEHKRIRAMLGELDDIAIAEIQATQADESEILEAAAWVQGDETLEQERHVPSSSRVTQVARILAAALSATEPDDGGAAGA